MNRERKYELFEMPISEWSDEDLLEMLTDSYTPPDIPKCCVCGETLNPSEIGGGSVSYACSQYEKEPDDSGMLRTKEGRRMLDDHWTQSRVGPIRQGDSIVMELVRRFKDNR